MRIIYLAHNTTSDFHNELYKPLRDSIINKEYNIILPHEFSDKPYDSLGLFRKEAKNIIIVAEISLASTGLGIELGIAMMQKIPIICCYRKGAKYSSSAKMLSVASFEYSNKDDFISKLGSELKSI